MTKELETISGKESLMREIEELNKIALNEISSKYPEQILEYHNSKHTEKVLERLTKIHALVKKHSFASTLSNSRQHTLLQLAGAFHDVVQIWEEEKDEHNLVHRQRKAGENELHSAEMVETVMNARIFSEVDKQFVKDAIAGTQIGKRSKDDVARLLAFADTGTLVFDGVISFLNDTKRLIREEYPNIHDDGQISRAHIKETISHYLEKTKKFIDYLQEEFTWFQSLFIQPISISDLNENVKEVSNPLHIFEEAKQALQILQEELNNLSEDENPYIITAETMPSEMKFNLDKGIKEIILKIHSRNIFIKELNITGANATYQLLNDKQPQSYIFMHIFTQDEKLVIEFTTDIETENNEIKNDIKGIQFIVQDVLKTANEINKIPFEFIELNI